MKLLLTCALLLSVSTALYADDKHPCKPKREAKHAARKALHECIESWARDNKPGESDPSDDCNGKMSAFVSAAKDVKACFTEHHKK